MYRLHMGPQVLRVVLEWHESVGYPTFASSTSLSPSRANSDDLRVTSRQPVMADEVQTFKALITIHKVLQEGHPIAVKEAQQNVNWVESLTRGVSGEGMRGILLAGEMLHMEGSAMADYMGQATARS